MIGRLPDSIREAQSWDHTAADYEAFADPFTRQYAEQALALAGGVTAGEHMLDVATGTGAPTLLAARAGSHVLATDLSPSIVARLRRRFEAEGLTDAGCEARGMDGQALDLPDGSFAPASSMLGVMLVPDHRKGLAETARVLRPGSGAIIGVWADEVGAGPPPVLIEAYRAPFPEKDMPDFPPGLRRLKDPGAVAEDMQEVGLGEVAVHTISDVWTAPLANWVADNAGRLYRQFPLRAALTATEWECVREALRTPLAARHPSEVPITSGAHVGIGFR